MCVIVSKPKDKKLEENIWRTCFQMHKDGAGFAFVDDKGNLVMEKGFMTMDALWERIKDLQDKELMVHFRTASPNMVIDKESTHPFEYVGQTFRTKKGDKPRFKFVICHNGRLPWRSTAFMSDTQCFVNDLLGPHLERDPWFLDSGTGVTMLTRIVTTPTCDNKLVIMRHDAETNETKTYIINKDKGDEDHGCWFSNESWWVDPKPWRSAHFFGRGRDDKDAEEAERLRAYYTVADENGWSWSYNWDCWMHWGDKKWTEYMPGRRSPEYAIGGFTRTKNPPSGWKRVWLTGVIEPINPNKGREDKGRKAINVPRDAGVIDTPKIPDLDHLNDDERAMLCQEAVRYMKSTGCSKKDIRGYSSAEKIDWLRDGMQSFWPNKFADMNHIDIDMIMLAMIKDGKLKLEVDTTETLQLPMHGEEFP